VTRKNAFVTRRSDADVMCKVITVRKMTFGHQELELQSRGVNKVSLRTSFSIKNIWSMTIDGTQNEVASPLQHCDKLLMKGT
jgi:hypothetical protein